jgi:hypothetical protein
MNKPHWGIPTALIIGIGISAYHLDSNAAESKVTAKVSAQCSVQADIRRDASPACWSLQCASKRPVKLGCDLTEMHQIVALSVSPDHQWLAVMTVGEGHPILEIIDLPRFIKQHQYSSSCTINPFPGTLDISGWNKAGLIITSGVDLDSPDSPEKPRAVLDAERKFQVIPKGCAVGALQE